MNYPNHPLFWGHYFGLDQVEVVGAGISLVTNYRDQFNQEVRNGGIDGLIAAIATKNRSLEGNSVKSEKK